MALYDLPAMIDYIINKTGSKCIFYVGHSMGTTTMFALLSNRTEYNDKVGIFIAFAPVVYLSPSPFTQAMQELEVAAASLVREKFDPSPDAVKQLQGALCSGAHRGSACSYMDGLFGGGSSLQNASQVGVIKAHFPEPTSVRTFKHFVQAGRDNTTFLQYDYGKKDNLVKYGQETPLSYDLANIRTPVALLYGLADATATPAAVAFLRPKLTSCFYDEAVNYTNFIHSDFTTAINASELVYYPTIKLLNGYLVGAICKK